MAFQMTLRNAFGRLALVAALSLVARTSHAAEYTLRAGSGTMTMPDGREVPMWGFACESAVPPATCENPGEVTVPGPRLQVPAGDSALTVHLVNDLPEEVSLVIPGLEATMTPVFFVDGAGRQRVRSFTHEAAAGDSATYVWGEVRPGTFLYQSGTHPAVQVQMGLYGAMSHPAGTGLAYAGVGFDLEHVLLFSEIDPALHDAVAGTATTPPTYGTAAYPSTIDYQPKYFLINGAPFTASTACLDGGLTAGQRILLRLLNAGLRELAPMILEAHWKVVAEGGHAYAITSGATSTPHGKEQYTVLLPPGGTGDVIFTPQAQGTFRILDRRLNLTNHLQPDGGFQACVAVGALAGQPVAEANGPYSGTAGLPIAFSSAGSAPNGGTIVAYQWTFGDGGTSTGANPSHTYAAAGTYAVGLTVTDSEGLTSAADHTTATVVRPNAAPTADANGPYQGRVGFPVAFDGTGSSDPDGDPLTFAWTFGDGGTGSGVSPTHVYQAPGTYPVSLTVNDGVASSGPSTSSAVITLNRAPTANPGGPYTQASLTVSFNGTGSSDPDGDALTYAWNFGDGTTGTGASPVHTYAVPATYTVTLTVNDGYVSSAPATTTATVSAPPPANKHVGDLDGTSANIGGNRWRATVTVTVHGTSHAPLANVTVNGNWSAGDGNGRTRSCTTNAAGQCNVTSGRLARAVDLSVGFTVTSLTGAGATYYQAANHDPDGSSNGTVITVPRP